MSPYKLIPTSTLRFSAVASRLLGMTIPKVRTEVRWNQFYRRRFNPHRAVGGGGWTSPSGFSQICAAVCGTPVFTSFPHIWKFQTQVTQGQVTRSGQVTSPQKKIGMLVIAISNDRTPWNFQRLISLKVSLKCLYPNFNIGDLTSGQICDFPIISQWEKNERHLFWTKNIQNT